jgi:hypothetical protein
MFNGNYSAGITHLCKEKVQYCLRRLFGCYSQILLVIVRERIFTKYYSRTASDNGTEKVLNRYNKVCLL